MQRIWQRFLAWLGNIPFKDPVEKQQAYLLQNMMLVLCALTIVSMPAGFWVSDTIGSAVRTNISSVVIFLFFIIALAVLRQGKLRRSVIIASAGLLMGFSGLLVVEGLRNSGWLLSAFMVPITLAGLLTGRKGILIVGGLSVAAILIVGALELNASGIVGAFPRAGDLLPSTMSTFFLSVVIVIFFFHRFSASLRDALTRTKEALATSEVLVAERTAALEEVRQTRDNLETIVAERTRDLTAVNQTMQRDLTLAHDIQLGLLPTQVPWATQRVLVSGRSIPAT
ncbi:MAG TPA: hypothetical protein VD886_15705, partial [Herpetosiphonaceae bacterium]|nr:hypothetical protein [Herpetosiphonaceae bacterium]